MSEDDAYTASSASQQQQQRQQQHIRPRVRKTEDAKASANKVASKTPTTTNAHDTLSNNAQDDALLVEETRLRMEKWMGVGEKPLSPSAEDVATFSTTSVVPTPASTSSAVAPASTSSAAAGAAVDVSTILKTAERMEERATTKPKVETTTDRSSAGILKKTPKYSNKSSNSSSLPGASSSKPTATPTAIQNPIIISDLVVERDPARPLPPRLNIAGNTTQRGDNSISPQNQHHAAVEGYVPRSVALGTTPSTASKPSKTKKALMKKYTSSPTTQAPPHASSPAVLLSDTVNGSTPQSEEQKDDKNDNPNSPLILSSVADLFQAAGQSLPEDTNANIINGDTQLVEADISFACMTQEQFKEQQERERQEQYQLFLGRQRIFKEEEDDDEEEEAKENDLQNYNTNESERFDNPEEEEEEQDEEDGNEMESILQNGFDGHEEEKDDYYEETGADDEGNDAMPEPRAFLKLWTTISEWMTPQAADWLNRLTASSSSSVISSENEQSNDTTDWTPQVDRSDVGASRCAGLMAMIKMNLPNSLKELQQSHIIRRTAERRLADWLRTFDYSMPMAKLDLKLWRAMTCILLDIVLPPSTSSSSGAPALSHLPESVVAVGMTREEYRYLTRSAVQSLGNSKTPLVVSN